jgi:hypothetical protein
MTGGCQAIAVVKHEHDRDNRLPSCCCCQHEVIMTGSYPSEKDTILVFVAEVNPSLYCV